MHLSEIQKMEWDQLLEAIRHWAGDRWAIRDGDLNSINHYVLSRGGPFQVTFVNNLRNVIGHHDHAEVEIVLATARLRAEALLMTLKNF